MATAIIAHWEGRPGDYRFSPVADLLAKNAHAIEAAGDTLKDPGNDKLRNDTLWKSAEALGYDFGIPGTAQFMASSGYLRHVANGDTNDNPAQAAAHLAFGYHKSK
jgi:hypothetical protein